jgi:carboxylesterase
MLGGWLIVLAVVLVLAAVNLAILLFAYYEYATSSRKSPWERSTQVLSPPAAGPQPSILMLHGFGGTPRDFCALAERLAERGFRVVVPAIPGQTSTSFAHARGRTSPTAYIAWVRDLIREETALAGRPPMLVGTSMGGALAVIGAAEQPVDRLVLLSPYFSLAVHDRWVTGFVRLLRWLLPVVPKAAKAQINDPDGYREYETGSYLVSLRAFLQLAELARIAQSKVPNLSVPTLVLASHNDTVASYAVTEHLFRSGKQVRMVAYDRGNHILTYDFDREPVLAETVGFLTEASPQPAAERPQD